MKNEGFSVSRIKKTLLTWFSAEEPRARTPLLDVTVLEDRILYSATPMPLDAAEPPPNVEAQLDDIQQIVFVELADSADEHAQEQSQLTQPSQLTYEISVGDVDAGTSSAFHDTNQAPEIEFEQVELSIVAEYNDDFQNEQIASNLLSDGGDSQLTRSEIAFIDSAVAGYEFIVANLEANVEVIILDSEQDGLLQITQALVGRSGVDALHIFSHGVDGGIQVGATWINDFSLQWQADIIASWSTALSTDADLLLYGCNIASTADGQSFLQELAALTGADVAASSDETGHASLGGDWELEYSTGSIEADSAVDAEEMDLWDDLLAITANGTATSAQTASGNSLSWSHTVASGSDRVLYVTLAIDGVGAGVNSVTYGGVNLTQVGRTAGNHAVEIWRLVNPSEGTANVVVSLGATTAIKGGAVTYNGVDQATPNGTYTSATGTGTTATLNVSSATGKLVLDITNWDNNPTGYTIGANQSSAWSLTNTAHRGVATTEAGAATVTMSSTVSASKQWEMGAISINASPLANVVPGSQTTPEDTSLVFSSGNGNQIWIDDQDPSGSNQEVTLSVTNGVLSLSGTTGLTFVTGDGTADSTMTFRGTVSSINAALNGLVYTPTSNYNGGATLTLSTTDSTLVTLDIDSSLRGRYSFDHTGSLGNDDSPAGAYDGTVVGATSVNDPIRGNVLSFDGNDYVQIAGHFGNPANVTMAAWINLTARDTIAGEVISLGDSITLQVDDIYGGLRSFIYNGSTWQDVSFNTTLAGTGWHHVAVTFDDAANMARLYLDGVQVASTTIFSSINYSLGSNTFIGRHGDGNTDYDFNGLIDDARVYNRALTAAEISVLANDLGLADTDSVNLTVTAVNDAPTITNGATVTLAGTGQSTTSSGTLASNILTSASWADVDASPSNGLAITATTGTGTWQYSTDGSTWNDFGAVTSTNALLITSSTQVRYVASASTETATFSFKAWDQTTGTASTNITASYASTSSSGGTTAYSSSTASTALAVTSVNYLVNAVDDNLSITEDVVTVIDPRTNDTDGNGDTKQIIDFTQTTNGALSYTGDGTLTYNPNGNYNGSDSFEYLVADSGLGLTHFWGLNGNGTDTVGGTNGTVSGATSVAGAFGQGYSFDEVNDVITTSDFIYANSFTISFDFRIDDNTGTKFQYIYSHGTVSTANSLNIYIAEASHGTYANQLFTNLQDSNDSAYAQELNFSIASIISDGLWHTYTLTVESGVGARVYLDGVLQASDATRGGDSLNPTTGLYLGGRNDLDANRYYGGRLDNVLVGNRAWANSEVTDWSNEVHRGSVALTVDAVNDAPVNSIPTNHYTPMNTPLTFSSGNGNALQISDVDAGSNSVSVTLSQTGGTLTLASTSGLTLTGGANGSASMTYTGTVSAINTALNSGLTFSPTTNDQGLAELTIQTNDLGNSGSGGSLTDTDIVKIHVGAVVVTNNNDLSNGTVTSIANLVANDGGDGISLREAIAAANNTLGSDTIEFSIGSGTQTISLATVLPSITETVIIDAWTQAGFSGTPVIIVDANGVTGDGFQLTSNADNSTIRGFVIRDFVGDGIQIDSGSTGNVIEGNYIGSFGAAGTDLGATEQNTGYGIHLLGSGNTIGGTTAQSRNVIGGNQLSGVYISGVNATNNTLIGNYIGVDATGAAAIANDYGINIGDASGTIIGNGTVGGRNVISGNTNQGVLLWNADNTTIQGNYVGTNAAGTGDLNGLVSDGTKSGIVVGGGTDNVLIGGTTNGQGNVISGNNWFGIEFWSGTTNSYVYGNYIGTDVTGLVDLGNSIGGVTMWGSGTGIVVGGGTTAHRNIISGNDWVGVSFGNAASAGKVQGNYIGLGVDGSTVIGNQVGVVVEGGSANATIGTDWDGSNDVGERNVISGNQWGIMIQDVGTTGTMVWGNYIGTDATGLLDRGNTSDGIIIQNGATGTQIGGTSTKRNIIAGNDGDGIQIDGETTDGTFIQNNYIGLGSDGTTVLGNAAVGINITGGADNTTIGGGSGLGNVIVGSGYNGIEINGASSGTIIQGNSIGINAAGTVIAGSQYHGIQLINGVSNTTIGGTTAGQGNTITGNGVGGTYVNGINLWATGTGNSMVGNSIYDNAGIGIDVDSEGVTPNDNLDADIGSNQQQNFPIISSSSVDVAGTTVTVSGSINTLASLTGVVIHFYATPSTGDVNRRDSKKYLGSTTVNTDASGNATFTSSSLTGYSGTVASGELITATATYANSTSELSASVMVTAASGSAPSDLAVVASEQGGLNLNNSTGNNAYLIADNGGAILDNRTAVTIEMQLSTTSFASNSTLFSYARTGSENEFIGILNATGELQIYIQGIAYTLAGFDLRTLNDGTTHGISITWDGVNGTAELFVDGVSRSSIGSVAQGLSIRSGGTLVFGQEQDSVDGGYSPGQILRAQLHDIRLFSDVRTAAEIAASYHSDLAYNEPDMIANWKFDNLSSNGVVTESVNGNNLTLKYVTGAGFTANAPTLSLQVTENALDGTVVGQVAAYDLDREARITQLLAADPDLRYSAETGKFYKLVSTYDTWANSQSTAMATTLGGVAGQLLTVDSAAENEIAQTFAVQVGDNVWLGFSDQVVEGEFQRYSGNTAGEIIWRGSGTGANVNGAYTNWQSGEPSNSGGTEDYADLNVTTGEWNDASSAGVRLSIIEWNADDVLDAASALTYTIQSQTVAGAFAIDATTGRIRVADGSLLDYETNAAHTVTVRVSDGTATYDEAFVISLQDMAFEVQQSIPLVIQNVNEDGTLTFAAGFGNAITVTDENGGTNSLMQVYLHVNNGTLMLSQTTGLSIPGGANGSSFMTIQGTESDINAALEGLTYTPTAEYNGGDSLTITTSL